VWSHTDKEEVLGNSTQLALYKDVSKLGLHALGELVKVDRDNALLQLQLQLNEKQGSLNKSFKLLLVAGLGLLEGVPELGSGLAVWDELKWRTRQLVVTRAEVVPLPPKRVVAAITKNSALTA